jgi:hypothetical protein
VVDKDIYYLDTKGKPRIVFFDFAKHRTTTAFELENPPAREAPGLATSADRKTILYPQLDGLNRDSFWWKIFADFGFS